jgi:hypothetical protein
MKVRIEIQVEDSKTVLPLLKSDVEEGVYFKSETGISGKAVPQPSRHAFPGSEVIVFVFEFAAAVSAGLIANWLYDRLRNKGATVIVGRKEIRIENAEKLKDVIIEATIQNDNEK